MLDAGTLEKYLKKVAGWLSAHPYEVIAIMMGNGNHVEPTMYIEPFRRAGLLPLLYIPPYRTMTLEQWPKLSEMILQNKRVVVTLDYGANQTAVPWLLNEFSYQWQTPFSPTDPTFPCTVDRPKHQLATISRDMMYMANHNLNVRVPIKASFLALARKEPYLIPGHTLFHQVNALKGNRSLGCSVEKCTTQWGRPPNWLLVDYYNRGDFNGSVFQAAATANNVTYNRTSCCGVEKENATGQRKFTKTERFWFIGSMVLLGMM